MFITPTRKHSPPADRRECNSYSSDTFARFRAVKAVSGFAVVAHARPGSHAGLAERRARCIHTQQLLHAPLTSTVVRLQIYNQGL